MCAHRHVCVCVSVHILKFYLSLIHIAPGKYCNFSISFPLVFCPLLPLNVYFLVPSSLSSAPPFGPGH